MLAIPIRPKYLASPAPMRIPSRTNTYPDSGCDTASTISPAVVASMTAGSVVKAYGSQTAVAPSSSPVITPKPNDQRIMVEVKARTVGTLEAPSSLPISAWAAMARASRAKAMVEYTLNTIWWAANTSVPKEVAVSTVAMIATRTEAERTSSQEPTWAVARRPAVVGAKPTSYLRMRGMRMAA